MRAYVTILPSWEFKIELAPENPDDEKILRNLMQDRIHDRSFGGMGAFDGVAITLRPVKLGPPASAATRPITFTCPAKTDEPRPSHQQRDDAG